MAHTQTCCRTERNRGTEVASTELKNNDDLRRSLPDFKPKATKVRV